MREAVSNLHFVIHKLIRIGLLYILIFIFIIIDTSRDVGNILQNHFEFFVKFEILCKI